MERRCERGEGTAPRGQGNVSGHPSVVSKLPRGIALPPDVRAKLVERLGRAIFEAARARVADETAADEDVAGTPPRAPLP